MKSSHKNYLSTYVLAFLGIVLMIKVIVAPKSTVSWVDKSDIKSADSIVCWYTGAENRAFFEKCADDFEKETGIAVTVKEQSSLNYFSEIYEAVKAEGEAPDVYLLEADGLEQAYYCQLTEENQCKDMYKEGWAENAIEASRCEGNMYGYPLYFNTGMFAYRTDYFETAPATIQEMIDYSVEHEPGEGVEKLLEWNLSDGFYNFPFFGAAIQWQEEEMGTIGWTCEEETYEACRTFFGNLTAAIELDEDTISSTSVVEDFKNGKTVAVFLDSDDMTELCEECCQIAGLPNLNEELPMVPVAKTTLLCVNAMSEKKDAAGEFATYVSREEIGKLTELTGHIPVCENALSTKEEKLAYAQYEEAVLEPDALNATDFWVKFQNEVLKIWNAEE